MRDYKRLKIRLLSIGALICGIPFLLLTVTQYIFYEHFQKSEWLFISIMVIFGVSILLLFISILLKNLDIQMPIHDLMNDLKEYNQTNEWKTTTNLSFAEVKELRDEITRLIATIQEHEAVIIHMKKLKTMGEMSAQIVHEIRNPLTTIRGMLQLLQEQPENRTMSENFLPMTLLEIDRMNEITERLLNYAKPKKIDFHPVSLTQLIHDLILQNIGIATTKEIVFNNRIQGEWMVYTEENRLRQVILNVVRNAIEASENGGVVIFDVKIAANHYLELSIRDTGKGFPSELMNQMGTCFLTTKDYGNGLGLATSMKLMDELEGSIHFQNLPTVGAEVILKIPMSRSLVFSA